MKELIGEVCDEFVAVCGRNDGLYQIFYAKFSNVYHRFYIDAGLLFWRSGEAPDEDDDLDDDNHYVDLGSKYDLLGTVIENISFKDDYLEMKFSSGRTFLFHAGIDDVGAKLIDEGVR